MGGFKSVGTDSIELAFLKFQLQVAVIKVFNIYMS